MRASARALNLMCLKSVTRQEELDRGGHGGPDHPARGTASPGTAGGCDDQRGRCLARVDGVEASGFDRRDSRRGRRHLRLTSAGQAAKDELVDARNRLACAIAGAAMSGLTKDEIVDLTGYPADL